MALVGSLFFPTERFTAEAKLPIERKINTCGDKYGEMKEITEKQK